MTQPLFIDASGALPEKDAPWDPIVITKRRRHFGTRAFAQVRVGAPTRGAADKLCASLKAAGAACLVLRN